MARHIWFDDECVTKAYDCWLKTYEIEPAEVRTVTDEIVGVDGIVDATEWMGRPIYDNRDGTFEFLFMPDGGWENVMKRVRAFRAKYNGRVVKIVTDDDPASYYSGRVTFGAVSNKKGSAQFSVSADLEPFEYRTLSKTVKVSGSGSTTFTFTNDCVRPLTMAYTMLNSSGYCKIAEDGGTANTLTSTGKITSTESVGDHSIVITNSVAYEIGVVMSWTEALV